MNNVVRKKTKYIDKHNISRNNIVLIVDSFNK